MILFLLCTKHILVNAFFNETKVIVSFDMNLQHFNHKYTFTMDDGRQCFQFDQNITMVLVMNNSNLCKKYEFRYSYYKV